MLGAACAIAFLLDAGIEFRANQSCNSVVLVCPAGKDQKQVSLLLVARSFPSRCMSIGTCGITTQSSEL